MNILLVIGVIILLGTVAGRVINKLHLPRVTGYIMVGLFLGQSFQGILTGPVLDTLRPLISLALGIIGFMIGSELNAAKFRKYSRSIYTILLFEAVLAFFLVAIVVILITDKVYMGLILGSLASATAPAATYSVLGEYKARGPLTTTTLSIVALDDGLALLIYGFASVFAKSFIVHEVPTFMRTMAIPVIEIALSVLIGSAAGFVLHKISIKQRERERILPLVLGTIILVVGLALHFKLDPILASMVMGAVASNMQSSDNREMFDTIKRFSTPIFILFFVLVGASLDVKVMAKGGVILLACAYMISRSVGKIAGVYIGGKISNARNNVTKYLGFCLFDQAGVAIGLAIATFHSFSLLGEEARLSGILILNIITATTFVLQIIAPPMIRYGIKKADEMNRDITREDIIDTHKVRDLMEEDFFIIKENNNLHQIMDIMKQSSSYNFPVVTMADKFMGIISLGEIRDAFHEEQMDALVMAGDIVREIDTVVYAEDGLQDAVDVFEKKNIDYLPVLESQEKPALVGQLEYRQLMDYITKEVLLRQQELEM